MIFVALVWPWAASAAPFLIESQKITASDGAASERFGQSVSVSGNTAVAGAPRAKVGANTTQGAAYIYERSAGGLNAWGQVRKLVAADGHPTSHFGEWVVINGDLIAVGAPFDGGINDPQGLGSVYLFERNAGGANNWGQIKKLKGGNGAGSFGWCIGVSGNNNTIVVGAPGGLKGVEIGEAYIFERDEGGANNWGLVRKVTASDPSQFDLFATSVAISEDTIVAGAPGADAGANANQGSVYVFQRNAGGANNWGQVRKLNSSDGAANDQFGVAVTVSGDTIVAGAYFDDNGARSDEGSAYIFERNLGDANNWGEAKKLTPSDGASNTFYGFALAVEGDRLAIGTNVSGNGALSFTSAVFTRPIYLYERNLGGANNWDELQKVSAVEDRPGDFFGRSLGMSGSTIIGGAVLADVGANNDQGAAYLFDAVTGPNPAIRGNTVTHRQDDTSAFPDLIAVVADDVTPPGSLTVTVVSAPAGITVSGITNDEGRVSGLVLASCSTAPGTYMVDLQVADGNGFSAIGKLTVIVTADTPPTLGDYPATTVGLTGNGQIAPSAAPSDLNGFPSFNVTASAPGFTGTLAIDKLTGVVSFFNAGPAGDYTVTVTATDRCGLTTSRTFALTVLGQGNTITVNTTSDAVANDGNCSLREAITSANTHNASGAASGECVAGLTGTDLIAFNISGAGPHTIAPNSALPDIIEPLIIDGITQPGAIGNVWPPTLKIVLNGANAGAGVTGLRIVSANNCLIRGLVVNQFGGAGIASVTSGTSTGAANNTIQGNFIGTNAAGTAALGNGSGVLLGGAGNLAGGTLPLLRNLISGNNGPGIVLSSGQSSAPRAEGNFIGTDVTGTLALGNAGDGVRIEGPSATVGGTAPGAGNVIAGNGQNGIYITPAASINRVPRVQGNFIGTDVTGTARLGNTAHGVFVAQGNFTAIGGNQAAARNIISANGGAGIRLSGAATFLTSVQNNYIGTDVSGSFNLGNGGDGIQLVNTSSQSIGNLFGLTPVGNRIAFNAGDGVRVEGSSAQNQITYNTIFGNGGLGINLGTDGVTPNDSGDGDSGPNDLQNFPVLISAITDGTSTTVQGSLNSKPDREFTVDFYSNAAADSSGNGEGEVWIGDVVIKTDAGGNATFAASLAAVPPGRFVTATATLTDLAAPSTERYGTSEFSNAQLVQGIGVSPASQLLNIATRLRVLNGENVLIGGFIITGTEPKKVMLRGIGPSLSSFFSGVLDDPVLELYQGATQLENNDNWKDGDRAAIEATGIPPGNDLESAIVRTLTPGAYTAIVRGKNGGTGIGLVEAYDLNQAANSKLANISTRGFVDSGNNVMIGGFIVGGTGGGGATVIIRAIGPTLGTFGVAGALQDPTLELYDGNGALLRDNNDWKETQQLEIEATSLAPPDDRESAVVQTVAPGAYTAIVRGKDNTTGVGLVEVYNVP